MPAQKIKAFLPRFFLYFVGLIFLSLGITLNTKTDLGASPVISVPYSISEIWGLNLANTVFIYYLLCLAVEALILRSRFRPYDLLQILMSYATSWFINLYDQYLHFEFPSFAWRLALLAIAILTTGIGITLTVMTRLIPNPADALAKVIGEALGKSVGFGKNVLDFTCFTISLALSFFFAHRIVGIGIGTAAAMIFTGRAVALFHFLLKKPLQWAGCLEHTNHHTVNSKLDLEP